MRAAAPAAARGGLTRRARASHVERGSTPPRTARLDLCIPRPQPAAERARRLTTRTQPVPSAWYGGLRVDAATIVVLGGSEPERDQLVAQLAACGLAARAETQLSTGDQLPSLLIVTGAEGSGVPADHGHRGARRRRDRRRAAAGPALGARRALPQPRPAEPQGRRG